MSAPLACTRCGRKYKAADGRTWSRLKLHDGNAVQVVELCAGCTAACLHFILKVKPS